MGCDMGYLLIIDRVIHRESCVNYFEIDFFVIVSSYFIHLFIVREN